MAHLKKSGARGSADAKVDQAEYCQQPFGQLHQGIFISTQQK